MSTYEKPSREDREKYTFSKQDLLDFIALLEAQGIPVIVWADKENDRKFINYSHEHFNRWVYDQIQLIKDKLGMKTG